MIVRRFATGPLPAGGCGPLLSFAHARARNANANAKNANFPPAHQKKVDMGASQDLLGQRDETETVVPSPGSEWIENSPWLLEHKGELVSATTWTDVNVVNASRVDTDLEFDPAISIHEWRGNSRPTAFCPLHRFDGQGQRIKSCRQDR